MLVCVRKRRVRVRNGKEKKPLVQEEHDRQYKNPKEEEVKITMNKHKHNQRGEAATPNN